MDIEAIKARCERHDRMVTLMHMQGEINRSERRNHLVLAVSGVTLVICLVLSVALS